MFRDHFGLQSDPFALSPNLKFLYMSKALEETMAHLAYGLEQGEDFILITGAIGTGKTLALHNLIAQVSATFQTVLINVTHLDYREMLKMICSELSLAYPENADKADLLTSLKGYLIELREDGRKLLLIIDEAQNLSSETLEGIRMLTNLGQPGAQCLQIVLVGQPSLATNILQPDLAQLRQRIRIHYSLDTLDRQEMENYISHRLRVAGRIKPLFSRKALDKIYKVSTGVPRLVNILGSRSLLAAYVDEGRSVEEKHVEVDATTATASDTPELAMEAPRPLFTPEESAPRKSPANSAASPGISGETDSPPEMGSSEESATHSQYVQLDSSEVYPHTQQVGHRRSLRPFWWAAAVMALIVIIFFAWPYLTGRNVERPGSSSGFPGLISRAEPVDSSHVQDSTLTDGPEVKGQETRVVEGGGPVSGAETDGPAAATEEDQIRPLVPDGTTGSVARSEPAADRELDPGRVDSGGEVNPANSSQPIQPRTTQSGQQPTQTEVHTTTPTPAVSAGTVAQIENADDRPDDAIPVAPGMQPPPPPPSSGFGVHVASFGQVARAEAFITELNEAGFPAFFVVKQISAEIWHRVYVGPYFSRQQAQRASQNLQQKDLAEYYFITKFGNG